MTRTQNTVILEESPRDNFTMIPNIVLNIGLGPYGVALYTYLRQIAGESGACWRSTETMARESGISVGKVVSCKRALEAAGLIRIHEEPCSSGVRHVITIVDIWDRNHQFYQGRKAKPSPDEVEPSPDEVEPSPGEVNKIPIIRSHEEDYVDQIDDVSASYCEEPQSENDDDAAASAGSDSPAAPDGAGGCAPQRRGVPEKPLAKPQPRPSEKPKPKPDPELAPQTREERVLFGQLQKAAQANGRRGPQRFQTPQQAEAFREAVEHLNGRTEAIIKAAVVRGITTLAGVVSYVAGAARNARAESAGETYGGVPVMRPVQIQIQED